MINLFKKVAETSKRHENADKKLSKQYEEAGKEMPDGEKKWGPWVGRLRDAIWMHLDEAGVKAVTDRYQIREDGAALYKDGNRLCSVMRATD